MKAKGTLFVVSAPSGAGKTSLVNKVVQQLDDVIISISYTTRAKREVEIDGKHYHFVDKEKFLSMIKQNAFLEHAKVFGNFYGTSRKWVEEQINAGYDVILEIDWQGAMKIQGQFSNLVSIFILPPDLDTLQQRLVNRKQDSNEVVEKRLSQAVIDISKYKKYDYVIVNELFDKALDQLLAIIKAKRLSVLTNEEVLRGFVEKLTF